jgi:membrane-bound serine protease (ClpP class)
MNAVVLLFLLGLLLLAFEVFTPGGVLGVMGGIAMAAGCVVAFYQFGTLTGVIAMVCAVAALGAMLWVELVLLPKTRFGRKLFLNQAVDAKSQPAVAEENVIGKSAEAVTTLAPSGYVMLDGRRYEAWSQSGYLPKGAVVRVIGLDNFRLIVTKS